MGLSTFDTWKHLNDAEETIEISGTTLKQVQSVLFMMLKDILFVCEKENITVMMGGGTCLGAVRQHGFIPWDDDIDINIMRADVNRLLDSMDKYFPGKYWVHDLHRTSGYELGFPRIRLQGTIYQNRDDLHNKEDGLCVDLFVIENAPQNALLRSLHGFGSLVLGFLYSCARFAEHADEYLALAQGHPEAQKQFMKKIRIGRLLRFKSARNWCILWDQWNSRCKKKTDYVTTPIGRKHYFGELYKRDDFLPVTYEHFRDIKVPVAHNTQRYLSRLFGEGYMQIPPREAQESHVVLALDLGKYKEETAR